MSDPYEADFVDDDPIDEPEDELDEDEPELEEEVEETDDEEEPEPAAARQPSRGENRVREATRIAAEAKRRADAAEARLAALEQQRIQPQGETAQARAARLAEMDPVERNILLHEERLAAIEMNTAERYDKLAFDNLCARDPVAAKLAPDVERELAALRARGQNVDRDTMLTFLLGQRARANSGRATGRAQKAATARREQNTARPANARSDAAPAERRSANDRAARDKRVADYKI